MRYFMRLSYNGKPYHGWQVQPNAESVQSVLEEAMGKLLRTQVAVTGAGRTDAGVNAAMMVAHFDVAEALADKDDFVYRLNSLVGRDIAIQDVAAVPDEAHARFDAISRTYKYYVHTEKSPFLYEFSWPVRGCALDFEKMNEAASRLIEYSDFTSFSKLHTDAKTNICKVTEAYWSKLPGEGGQWVFTISADRFLRNMVRAVVGTLVEVGRGRLSVSEFCEIIERKDRCAAGTSMPGEALFLWRVDYPESLGLPW